MTAHATALQTTASPGSLDLLLRELREESGSGVDAVFLTRALRALRGMTRDLDRESVTAAASAPSDVEVLLRAILRTQKALIEHHRENEPLLLARLRGQQARQALLDREGGTVSAAGVAEILGISRQAVNKRRQAGKLLALPLGRHGFAYPVWQLTAGGVLPGLVETLDALAGHDPWMQARFFLSETPRLDDATPLDELRRGNVETVLQAAEVYGEHGAA